MSLALLKRLLRPIYAPIVRPYRRAQGLRREQSRIRDDVRRAQQSGCAVKIIIGAGQTSIDDWIVTDMPAFDVLNDGHWERLFLPHSIDRMLAEHVFEHLTINDLVKFLAVARMYLAPSGRIRFAVPDGSHPDDCYIKSVRPGGTGEGAVDHKVLYTCDLIADLLSEQDFQFELLEYFDGDGRFHREQWSAEDGFVSRSAEHDKRNSDGQLNYTSLIVDCWL